MHSGPRRGILLLFMPIPLHNLKLQQRQCTIFIRLLTGAYSSRERYPAAEYSMH